MPKQSSIPRIRCTAELRKKAEIRARELKQDNISQYILDLIERDTEHINILSKEETLMQIILGQHPNPVDALVELIKDREITLEEFNYKLTLPPKLKAMVQSRL